jgi:hypothetical protein
MKTNITILAAVLMMSVNVSIFANEITTKGKSLESTNNISMLEEASESTIAVEEWMTGGLFATGIARIEMEKWMVDMDKFAAELETNRRTDMEIEAWMTEPMIVKNHLPVEEEEKEPALEDWMFNF